MGWYIVRTAPRHEREAKDELEHLEDEKSPAARIIGEVYLPLYRRTAWRGGEKTVRFCPSVSGYLFVLIDDSRLRLLVDGRGRFIRQQAVYDPYANTETLRTVVSGYRLLANRCVSDSDCGVSFSRVSRLDMERFRAYNDRLVDMMDNLKVIDVSYSRLEFENDKVRIIEGPYLGFEGVIKQVKERGKKDHRLVIPLGDKCLSIPSVRGFRHVIVREARCGAKAREVCVWRHIDRITGLLQAAGFADDASAWLRRILGGIGRDNTLSDYASSIERWIDVCGGHRRRQDADTASWRSCLASVRSLILGLSDADAGSLISISRWFSSTDRSAAFAVTEYIPDVRLRPFLTPTPGPDIPSGRDYAVLRHSGFTEIILRTDLSGCFNGYRSVAPAVCGQDEAEEDCVYYAHVGLFPDSGGSLMAMTNWGGFCREYLLREGEERERLLHDFSVHYPAFYSLLTAGDGSGTAFRELSSAVPFTGGFAVSVIPASQLSVTDPMATPEVSSAVRSLVITAAAAAVQIWQSPRLLFWRRLLQRYVLLHKEEVRD